MVIKESDAKPSIPAKKAPKKGKKPKKGKNLKDLGPPPGA